MYIFPRKKTKFSPFLNSLPACRNLLFVFFDTLVVQVGTVPTCTFFIAGCENCIKNHGIDCEFCLLKRIFEKVENSY